ncbi:MAG: helix-turn-helix transcriptional regulator [Kiritimatiellae bacterium]|nr:helix-turn-helix transcriptional regulator [Kiritimatiellia bacterium]
MSVSDVYPMEISYGPGRRGPHAPDMMAHPPGGEFQLMHLNLFETNEGPTRSREHFHDVYHIVIFEEADNQIRLNGELLDTHRGLCVMTHPEDSHCFPPKRPGRTVYHALTFRFADMDAPPPATEVLTHYTGIDLRGALPRFTLPETAMLRLPGLLAALRSPLPPRNAIAEARLHQAILGLFLFVAEQLSAGIATRPPDRSPIEAAHAYLDAHYADGPSIAALARDIGVTPAHFGRAFRERYGVSPGRYRDQLRIDAAVNLLQHSDLLIKTIAYELGYPDSSTFSKAFRRHTGRAPLSYRR